MTRPVVVVGAGALGCVLAAQFSRRRQVHLVARPRSAAALRSQGGIRLEGLGAGLYPVRVRCRPAAPRSALILLAVKAYDLEAALRELAPRIDPSHLVVVLQNGLGVRTLAERVLGRPVHRAVTFLAAARLGPGRVAYNAAGKTYLPSVGELVQLWRTAGLPATPVDDLAPYVWRKLALNAVINPLSAVLGVPNGALLRSPETVRALVVELVPVARNAGQRLDVDETVAKIAASVRQTARNTSSMLQDLRAGRRTEIDWINGALVRRADLAGLQVPRHRQLVELVHFLESRGGP